MQGRSWQVTSKYIYGKANKRVDLLCNTLIKELIDKRNYAVLVVDHISCPSFY